MSSAKVNILLSIVVPVAAIFNFSCVGDDRKSENSTGTADQSLHWYRQAIVDLGAQIHMFSPDDGVAISRGMGKDVKGKAYRFSKGKWTPFYEYAYSDYPLIAGENQKNLWTVHHSTHEGAYRPNLTEFSSGTKRNIPLPKIMWDDVDYVMFKGLFRCKDGTAWMAGQQGHIIYYDGTKWNKAEFPHRKTNKTSGYEGDINDIVMTSPHTGWAVGRDGRILRYQNRKWNYADSPVNQTLNKISMINDSTGWGVGNGGTIIECRNYRWNTVTLDVRDQLNSVIALNEREAWIVGANAVLLKYNGSQWNRETSIAVFDDFFSDISAVKDSAGRVHLWIIGNQGIYTASQSLGFSFTDITNPAGLHRTGKAGHFIQRNRNELPQLLIANDGGSNLLFMNRGRNLFSDITAETELLTAPKDAAVIAVGDVNNDGEQDVLEVIDQRNFKFFLGTAGGGYRDFTERSKLMFDEINPMSQNAAAFLDLNNDGNLDLYLSNFDLPDQIFAGDGTGTFFRLSAETGIRKILKHASYGAVFGDFNNDGQTDVFIPYYVSSENRFFSLFLNTGGFRFLEKENALFFSRSDLSPTAVTVADMNNDGNCDLFIHSQKIAPMLWLNDGTGSFTEMSISAGPNVHPEPINGIVAAGDVNNDGWIDIFDGSKLFLNSSGVSMTEVSERVGLQFTGTPAMADIDNDGDLDIFIGSSRSSLGKGDRAALFRNNLDRKNFIKVRLEGSISNRSAVGAKVIVLSSGGNVQSRSVGSGGSQLIAQNLHELHFGIDMVDTCSVEVRFPSGVVRRVDGVHPGTIAKISETNPFQEMVLSVSRSLKRTAILFSASNVFPKVTSLIVLLFLLSAAAKKGNVEKLLFRWYMQTAVIVLFLALIHFSIYQHEIVSTAIAFGGTGISTVIALYFGKVIIERREARFIAHYRIYELLGAGGMGSVYKAVDSVTKNVVALKVLNPELLKDPENRRRLSAEGHLLSSFNHPHIVKVFEIGESSGRGYIAMEYLGGGTLRQKLEQEHPLSKVDIAKFFIQVCDGLEEVHQKGIVHRDLKTGNLMLTGDGNIRIMDFGLSKSPLVTTMTSLGTVLGTLGYVAPEQITSMNVDQRTDIFSLGVILYELLTMELPFKGENEIALIHSIFNTEPPVPSTFRNDIPAGWEPIIMKCLAKDANKRYSSVAELKEEFQKIQLDTSSDS